MKLINWRIVVVAIMQSVLAPIWTPPSDQASKVRGWRESLEVEEERRRSRSPHRSHGAKAMLLSWAKGENPAVSICRLAYAIVTIDGSDCGQGMKRLAGLSAPTAGSEKTAQDDCASYWLIQHCPR